MTTHTTRPHRLARTGLLATAWMLACLWSSPAPAQGLPFGCQLGSTYTGDKGTQSVSNPMGPPVLNIVKDTPVGTTVFSGPLPPIPYVCQSGTALSLRFGPALVGTANFVNLHVSLQKVGLGLRLKFPDATPWIPTAPGTDLSTGYQVLPNYTQPHTAFPGTLRGTLELFVERQVSSPVQVLLPATPDLFELVYGPGRATDNKISIGMSSNTWVRMIPAQCLVTVAVPNTVNLGVAYVADKFPMPPARPFDVKMALNPDCDGFGDPSHWTGFVLPVDIMFDIPGTPAGAVASPLKNDAGDPNGLDLVIKLAGAIPVHFNQWESAVSLTSVQPVTSLSYTASLARNGAPVKTGKFSQQVIVRVQYL